MTNHSKRKREKIGNFFLLILQRFWLTFELFNKNGLMNHAAACAYGFLLSAAPALLFISFVASFFLSASPELVESMLGNMEPLFGVFDVKSFIISFLTTSSGLTGLISAVAILWTTRLCTLSIQRGLSVVFPGASSVIKNNVIPLALGLLAMFVILPSLIGLRTAIMLFSAQEMMPDTASAYLIDIASKFVFMFSLGLLVMAAYRFFPAKHPKMKDIIIGALACIVFYLVFETVSAMLVNPDRYDLIYGALGRLFLFLVNIYFFFVFFFFGGQLIKVLDVSDALLFVRLREAYSNNANTKNIIDKLFAVITKPLERYCAFYKEGEIIIEKKSKGLEIYYILSGEAGVYLDKDNQNKISTISEANFFGEMAFITSDERAATIKAETDMSVLILPPEIFKIILQLDSDIDQSLIKKLSLQIKTFNNQIYSE